MARPVVFEKHDMPKAVVVIVKAICADYKRRCYILRSVKTPNEVKDRCLEFNKAVEKAITEVEEGIRKDLINDIATSKGYERSEIQYFISKEAYYNRKNKIIWDIAKELRLL